MTDSSAEGGDGGVDRILDRHTMTARLGLITSSILDICISKV